MTVSGQGRVAFIGAVHEAAPALDALLASRHVDVVGVLTSTHAESRRLSGAIALHERASRAGVPVVRADNANDPQVVAGIRDLRPDLVIVVGWNQLIKRELLGVPRHGCVGFHASLLPKHRGHAPVNWAILRGENTTGNTMIMFDPGADTGDIVAQRVIPIHPEDTCSSVYRRVGQAGADMLVEHLPALVRGTAARHPQSPAAGDVLPRRTPEMGIIDWNQPARKVHNWVRALTAPYPGAFTVLGAHPVMVWATRLPDAHEPAGEPGELLDVTSEGARIGVRGGSIVVTRMSRANQEPQDAVQWVQGAGVRPGTRFDPVDAAVADWARGEGRQPAEAR